MATNKMGGLVKKGTAFSLESDRYIGYIGAIGLHTVKRRSLILQVAQLWQRDRPSSAILRWLVNLRLNFRLKNYVSRQ